MVNAIPHLILFGVVLCLPKHWSCAFCRRWSRFRQCDSGLGASGCFRFFVYYHQSPFYTWCGSSFIIHVRWDKREGWFLIQHSSWRARTLNRTKGPSPACHFAHPALPDLFAVAGKVWLLPRHGSYRCAHHHWDRSLKAVTVHVKFSFKALQGMGRFGEAYWMGNSSPPAHQIWLTLGTLVSNGDAALPALTVDIRRFVCFFFLLSGFGRRCIFVCFRRWAVVYDIIGVIGH